MTNLLVNVSDLGFGLLANISAATPAPYSQTQKFLNLFERESKLLSMFDELQPLYGVIRENTISGSCSRRFWNQTAPLIVPDGLDVYSAEPLPPCSYLPCHEYKSVLGYGVQATKSLADSTR